MSIVERVKRTACVLLAAAFVLLAQLLKGDRAAPRHRANKEPPSWN